MVTSEIENLPRDVSNTAQNLSSLQNKAIQSLKNNNQIIIKEADKGGSVVVLDYDHYRQLCHDILDNQSWYKKIPFSTIDQYMAEFYGLIDEALFYNVIPKSLWEFLHIDNPTIPTFYVLPKIHEPDPLRGRPIISGNNNLKEGASRLIDEILKPYVESLSSFVSHTLSFLQFIDGLCVPPGSFLATIDIESLYNSITHKLGLKTITYFFKQKNRIISSFDQFILKLLDFVLTHNTFIFDGVAMGTPCAPGYANLYLGAWEHELFSSEGLPTGTLMTFSSCGTVRDHSYRIFWIN